MTAQTATPWPSRRDLGRPALIAHRGETLLEPENTIPAFEAAVAAGADLIEIDVKLSRDGVPVVFHDDSLARMAGGLAGTTRDLDAEALAAVASCHPDTGRTAPIPTLVEVLAWARGRVPLLVELKTHPLLDPQAARAVGEAVRGAEGILVYSSDHAVVAEVAAAAQGIPHGLILNENTPFLGAILDDSRPALLSQAIAVLTPSAVSAAHARGTAVSTEVRSPEDIGLVRRLGADAVVNTKYPFAHLVEWVASTEWGEH
ncbi:glycerophosphodiester phosphodiesterase [Sinomonas halotolerans]|uniref:Glycerophosphodiester phosphodiesterase n=1 Tax=Sinomonas halotolerans TaxID=1644133 RepID=A0ABU9X1Z3_9MICC